MNKQNQLKLAAFFDEAAEGELACDILKAQLANCKGFSVEALFKQIAEGAATISIDQLSNYLRSKQNLNEKQIYTLFEKFDGAREGVITKEDFARELTPSTGNKRGSNTASKLNPEAQSLFATLIKQYIDREMILDMCRKDLQNIPPYNVFDEVAQHQRGFLGSDELKQFMKRCDMPMKDNLLWFAMHSLKRRCYRFITLEVFCENLQPLEFGYYKAFEQRLKQHGEEQYMRRSRQEDEQAQRQRIDRQKSEASAKKEQRRLQAQVQKNLESEKQIRHQISRDMEQQARMSRRVELQAQKITRWSAQRDDLILQEEARLAQISRMRMLEAEAARRTEEAVALRLQRNARANMYDIEASRRQIQYEREAFERDALLQQQIRADMARHRTARFAREAQQQRIRIREAALRQQQRDLLIKRERSSLLRKQLQYEQLKHQVVPRFNYTAAKSTNHKHDSALSRTAEDSRKKVTFGGDRDLKKSYIV